MIRFIAACALLSTVAVPAAAKPILPRAPMLGVPQADCDALSTNQRLDAATLRDLRPAHSLDAAAEVLNKHGIKYVRSQGVLPLDGLSERELHNIATLPQGEPIILPADEGSAICVLRPSADSI